MKLTIEPRKTTWVSFVDSRAQLKVEWRMRAEYQSHNVRNPLTWPVKSRYTFSGIEGALALPSAQLILLEEGVPLAITQSVASAVKDRFQSEEVDDPFVAVTDRLASLRKSDLKQTKLAKGLIERTWTETIERSIHIENRTGKLVKLIFTLVDHPAEELEFVQADPAPERSTPPEYVFNLELAVDAIKLLKVTLRQRRSESIRTPVEPVAYGAGANRAQLANEDMQELMEEEVDMPQQMNINPPDIK
jgi:hypothetical protein